MFGGSGSGNLTIGQNDYNSGSNSIAIGTSTYAVSLRSLALGSYARADSTGSVAIGHGVSTSSSSTPGQVVLGTYNEIRDDAAFIIGNGTGNSEYDPATGNYESNRSILFFITTDGKGVFRHKDYIEPTTQQLVPTQPKEALRVKGDATVEGTLRIQPAGDLSMGQFTTAP
jgi:hypothetical protein